MCLATVQYAILKESDFNIGYKLLQLDENSNNYEGTDFLGFLTKNEWMTSRKPVVNADRGNREKYLAGFHLFTTPKDAYAYLDSSDYVVGKFEYKTLLAIGQQECCDDTRRLCIVADQIRFIDIVDFKKEKENVSTSC